MADIRLTQSTAQTQIFTPHMQQALAILQAPALELRSLVQEEIAKNPVLEEITEAPSEEWEEITQEKTEPLTNKSEESEVSWDLSSIRHSHRDQDEAQRRQFFFDSLTKPETLAEHLTQQLHLNSSDPQQIQIGEIIIGSLDSDGFLRISLDEISNLSHSNNESVKATLQLIQGFHPSGIAARDLKECLLLQLQRLGKTKSLESILVANHLEDLAHHRYEILAKQLQTDPNTIQAAAQTIAKLDPKPGRAFLPEEKHQIVRAEFAVRKVKEDWKIIFNPHASPRLKISDTYKDMLASNNGDSKEVRDYLREKIRSGRSFMDWIQQRQDTLQKIAQVIIEKQRDFFEHGVSHLKPLTLAQVAQEIGIHETTVSRAIANKYMDTPWGIQELKFFFTSGYRNHASGQIISNQSIKESLRELIEHEDKRNPYSDEEIIKIFSERGITIARRTIAKYRKELKILPSSLRRVL
ncbi:MAG: RNA polymerase factor sigma-54 [Verrucomicrobiae bacterium]|nr:RNA polymerase factor sigma-54 [Verrucomicrobiae bacterium]